MTQIVTGEAVALDLRVARVGSRSVALLLDYVIEGVALLLLTLVFGRASALDGAAQQALVLVLYLGVALGYPVAFETLWQGRTPGKAAMGLRVVRDDGGPVRFRHALIRALVMLIVEIPTLYAAAIISSLASERGKRLGDRAAGTIVLQERVPSRIVAPVPMPAPLAAWAATVDLSRVSNELAMGIRQFFERSAELSPPARDQLGRSLTTAVVAAIAPAPPPGAPAWAVLAAVLAERRRRDAYRMQQQPGSTGQPTPPASWQGPVAPRWGAQPAAPQWSASAPGTGPQPYFGPRPAVSRPPRYGPPTAWPAAPPPVPAPRPVPAADPPVDGFHPPA